MSKSPIRILLCEDDPNLGKLLSDYLNAKGYVTTWAQDGAEGVKQYHRGTFDFIILDVMMPRKDGFEVATEIRRESKQIPILFLSARGMKEDTLEGFKVGADDYMTKPFSMEELLVRIQAILRRTASLPQAGEEVTKYMVGKYSFDYNSQLLQLDSETFRLTTKENELLFLLVRKRNGLLERNHALAAIWGDANYFNGRSMDVYIAKLRKHLKDDDRIEILNVHGKGFKLIAPEG
ncbi:MAG: response regulator transcription factor [Flavobacteriales bacterium]|jgi:DNA-binding response OmpR family regulator